jgi:hypothetical protein
MNAKIEKEDVYQNTAGKHTFHEIKNRNGEWVCEYAIANNMKIIRTYYQHKRMHKGTWISQDGNMLNQILLLLYSVALIHTRTIPTERPPPVGEVSANFCG